MATGSERVAIAVGSRVKARAPSTPAAPGFEAFHAVERDRLLGALAFALGDVVLAGEAVDEAMARAYQRWATVGRYEDPAGWVYRVATNWARSVWRRSQWIASGPLPDVPSPSGGSTLPDPHLWAAVAALPDGQRDTVVLRFVLDWSHERIATALGVTPGTARSRLSRGLEALRAQLAEERR